MKTYRAEIETIIVVNEEEYDIRVDVEYECDEDRNITIYDVLGFSDCPKHLYDDISHHEILKQIENQERAIDNLYEAHADSGESSFICGDYKDY